MAISLQKGANINLLKSELNLKQVLVGLGREARSTKGSDFDLDASLFLVRDNGRVRCVLTCPKITPPRLR